MSALCGARAGVGSLALGLGGEQEPARARADKQCPGAFSRAFPEGEDYQMKLFKHYGPAGLFSEYSRSVCHW